MRAGLVGGLFRGCRGLAQFTFAAAGKHGPPDNHDENEQGQQRFQQNQTHAKTPFLDPPPVAGRLLDGRDCRHAGSLLGRPRGANPAHLKPIVLAHAYAQHGRRPAPAARPAEKSRFGIGSLINRMAGHGAEPAAERAPLAQIWRDPQEPICQVQAQAEGWSIGWRVHPSQVFELGRVQAWLAGLPWRRAKLVLHGESGWHSANALYGAPLQWRISEWRRDSRLELIFAAPQQAQALQAGLLACRRR